jgi:hypothetical protein
VYGIGRSEDLRRQDGLEGDLRVLWAKIEAIHSMQPKLAEVRLARRRCDSG